MKLATRLITIAGVGLCSFALLARMANFAHFGTSRRATKAAETSKSMESGGAMETAWAAQTVANPAPKAGVDGTRLDDAMQQHLVAQERAGLEALKLGDVGLFGGMLGEDAMFVDDHGAATKAQVLKNVGDFRILEYAMEDVRLVRISDTAGLIVYKLTEQGSSHGREFNATVYVSTLYALRGGKWVSLFSQETAARKPQ
jgi:hypothetical protein